MTWDWFFLAPKTLRPIMIPFCAPVDPVIQCGFMLSLFASAAKTLSSSRLRKTSVSPEAKPPQRFFSTDF
jgi:hypothetical protein